MSSLSPGGDKETGLASVFWNVIINLWWTIWIFHSNSADKSRSTRYRRVRATRGNEVVGDLWRIFDNKFFSFAIEMKSLFLVVECWRWITQNCVIFDLCLAFFLLITIFYLISHISWHILTLQLCRSFPRLSSTTRGKRKFKYIRNTIWEEEKYAKECFSLLELQSSLLYDSLHRIHFNTPISSLMLRESTKYNKRTHIFHPSQCLFCLLLAALCTLAEHALRISRKEPRKRGGKEIKEVEVARLSNVDSSQKKRAEKSLLFDLDQTKTIAYTHCSTQVSLYQCVWAFLSWNEWERERARLN